MILVGDVDLYGEKTALADLAHDANVQTGIDLQAWPVSSDEWQDPEKHGNPFLVQAMRRDGLSLGVPKDRRIGLACPLAWSCYGLPSPGCGL